MLAQQQQQNEQQQQEYMRQQQLQQMMQQQQQQQQQEEFMRQQMFLQQQQQQSLQPQHTSVGSNNPFAPRQPGSLLDQPTGMQNNGFQQSSFLPVPQTQTQQSSPSPNITPTPSSPAKPVWTPPAPKKDDGAHAGLAGLLARGREDGLDTFGNQGNLRIPVGQQFHGSNRLAIQQTGNFGANNPFGQVGQNQNQQQNQQQQQNNDQPFFSI